jgi:hypothetical protein
MSSRRTPQPALLGFDALLASAESANLTRQIERDCAHLPGNLVDAVPFYRALIEQHHAAMLAADLKQIRELREEAHRLASKLNRFEPGIIADADSPGCVLDRATRAPEGRVPLWGQSGSFEVACGRMRLRIALEGIFGLTACLMNWLGFEVRAIELDRPFLSETGYRSFLGVGGAMQAGITPDVFAARIIAAHVERDLKGRLVAIKPEFRRADAETAP